MLSIISAYVPGRSCAFGTLPFVFLSLLDRGRTLIGGGFFSSYIILILCPAFDKPLHPCVFVVVRVRDMDRNGQHFSRGRLEKSSIIGSTWEGSLWLRLPARRRYVHAVFPQLFTVTEKAKHQYDPIQLIPKRRMHICVGVLN